MANTERLTVLAKVRESKKSVQELLEDDTIVGKDRALLEDLEGQLDEAEDDLILGELSDKIDDLEEASSSLGKVVKKMGQSAKKIQKIADGVADAAKALKVLADIAAKAATIV
jgi:ABC-type transporter Mla subunit MlaD